MAKSSRQGLSARSTNVVQNSTNAKGENGAAWCKSILNALGHRLHLLSLRKNLTPTAPGMTGKRKHAEITPSYMRPTKSFAPKQQRCVNVLSKSVKLDGLQQNTSFPIIAANMWISRNARNQGPAKTRLRSQSRQHS